MYNIDEYKQGRYVLEPWFEAMSDAHRQAIREYLGWHLLVKAKKNWVDYLHLGVALLIIAGVPGLIY